MYVSVYIFFFFNDTATTEIYTLSLHDALPISGRCGGARGGAGPSGQRPEAPRPVARRHGGQEDLPPEKSRLGAVRGLHLARLRVSEQRGESDPRVPG